MIDENVRRCETSLNTNSGILGVSNLKNILPGWDMHTPQQVARHRSVVDFCGFRSRDWNTQLSIGEWPLCHFWLPEAIWATKKESCFNRNYKGSCSSLQSTIDLFFVARLFLGTSPWVWFLPQPIKIKRYQCIPTTQRSASIQFDTVYPLCPSEPGWQGPWKKADGQEEKKTTSKNDFHKSSLSNLKSGPCLSMFTKGSIRSGSSLDRAVVRSKKSEVCRRIPLRLCAVPWGRPAWAIWGTLFVFLADAKGLQT